MVYSYRPALGSSALSVDSSQSIPHGGPDSGVCLCLWGWLAIIAQGGFHPAVHLNAQPGDQPPLPKDLSAALSNQYQVGKTRLASQFARSFHRLYHGPAANYCPAP
jgi:hypothetical protein